MMPPPTPLLAGIPVRTRNSPDWPYIPQDTITAIAVLQKLFWAQHKPVTGFFPPFASVAAITVITYLMGMAVRASRMDNKWIPILCGLLGGLLGLVSFYLLPIPDYPAGDPITAAAVGIVSGLAATGLHQAAKQLSKEAGGDA